MYFKIKQLKPLQTFAPSRIIEKTGLDFNAGPSGKEQQKKLIEIKQVLPKLLGQFPSFLLDL